MATSSGPIALRFTGTEIEGGDDVVEAFSRAAFDRMMTAAWKARTDALNSVIPELESALATRLLQRPERGSLKLELFGDGPVRVVGDEPTAFEVKELLRDLAARITSAGNASPLLRLPTVVFEFREVDSSTEERAPEERGRTFRSTLSLSNIQEDGVLADRRLIVDNDPLMVPAETWATLDRALDPKLGVFTECFLSDSACYSVINDISTGQGSLVVTCAPAKAPNVATNLVLCEASRTELQALLDSLENTSGLPEMAIRFTVGVLDEGSAPERDFVAVRRSVSVFASGTEHIVHSRRFSVY